MTDTTTTNPEAVLSSGELKRRDPEREAFEAWLNPGHHAGNVSPWVEPGRYEKETHQLAWLAWQAARPKRSAIGRLINLSADCALRKPLRSLAPLTEATHIGHRQFGRAYDRADDALAVLSLDLRAAIDAL